MKKVLILIAAAFLSLPAFAQNKNVDTASFTVSGICGMCQERIENAAYIKGVKKATWDKDKQTLTVIYQPKKVTQLEVEQSVAKAGHDTEHVKATEEDYAKIHACCKYREDEVH